MTNSGILLLTAAFSTAFWGITVHAANNFIEDVLLKLNIIAFTAFSAKYLDDKLSDYRNSVNIDLIKDVKVLVNNKRQIRQLLKKPMAFKNGAEFRMILQNLIEEYYLKAIESNNTEVQDLLINLIVGYYIDSLPFQEIMVFGHEKTGDTNINDAKYKMLKFFYLSNAITFGNNYNETNIAYRINNQRRIIRLLLSANKRADIEKLNTRLNDDIQNTLFLNTAIEAMNAIPESYLRNTLSETQYRSLNMAISVGEMIYSLEDIFSFYDIPDHLGYMHMKITANKDALREIMLSDLPSKYRLHALLRLSTVEYGPFSPGANLRRILERRNAIIEEKIDIPKGAENKLFRESVKILNEASKNKFLTGNNYFDSLEAEMLVTAAAVVLHKKYPGIDLVGFLKQLKFTFVRDGNTELIVQYTGSDESEYFKFAMDNAGNYINSIKGFVESIYRRNKDGVSDDKFKPVAKGPLSLIKVIRKPITYAIIIAIAALTSI